MDQMGQTGPNGLHGSNKNETDRTGTEWTEQYLYVGDACMVIKEYRTKFMNIKILRGG